MKVCVFEPCVSVCYKSPVFRKLTWLFAVAGYDFAVRISDIVQAAGKNSYRNAFVVEVDVVFYGFDVRDFYVFNLVEITQGL